MSLSRAKLLRAIFLLLVASLAMTTVGVVSPAKSESRTSGDDSGADSDWAELSASMEAMHLSLAAVHQSGHSDVNFVRLMLPHHQAAIDMAKVQLKYGNDPQMRRLAQEIITDQQSEIELMNLWLKRHDSDLKPKSK